ncbi:unnamed protein product, partial [Protopolystoma xenopodis]
MRYRASSTPRRDKGDGEGEGEGECGTRRRDNRSDGASSEHEWKETSRSHGPRKRCGGCGGCGGCERLVRWENWGGGERHAGAQLIHEAGRIGEQKTSVAGRVVLAIGVSIAGRAQSRLGQSGQTGWRCADW